MRTPEDLTEAECYELTLLMAAVVDDYAARLKAFNEKNRTSLGGQIRLCALGWPAPKPVNMNRMWSANFAIREVDRLT